MFGRAPYAQPDLSPHMLNPAIHPAERRLPAKSVETDCMADLARI